MGQKKKCLYRTIEYLVEVIFIKKFLMKSSLYDSVFIIIISSNNAILYSFYIKSTTEIQIKVLLSLILFKKLTIYLFLN